MLASTAAGQTITALPSFGFDPNSGDHSGAAAVNATGNVVVGYASSPIGIRGFRWSSPGGMANLGPFGGFTDADAVDVSSDGEVVTGNGYLPNIQISGRPYRWTSGGGSQPIGATTATNARGMSADGNVIAGNTQLSLPIELFRWTSSGGFQALGLLPGEGMLNTTAADISGDGSTIVGVAQQFTDAVYIHPVRWQQNTGIVSLGWLPGDTEGGALAVSYDGSVIVGYTKLFNTFNPKRLVRWVNGQIEDLGVYADDTDTLGYAVTNDGIVIAGGSGPFPGGDSAWVWNQTLGFEELRTYLTDAGVNVTGWSRFTEVFDISADGRALVGRGIFNGANRGFVVRGLPPICGPRLLGGPQPTLGCVGGSLALFVAALSPTTLAPQYQWQKLGNDGEWNDLTTMTSPWGTTFSGANSSMLVISNASTIDVPGNYRCVVTAGCGSRASAAALVTLSTGVPVYPQQPVNQNVCPDGTAVYSTGTWFPGGGPYTFQWQYELAPNTGNFADLPNGGTNQWHADNGIHRGIVSGATTPVMSIAADLMNDRTLGPPHNRKYRCVVTNGCASVLSAEAGLKVVSCVMADLNNDFVVTVSDIGPFVLLLTNPAEFAVQYPDSNPDNGDLNNDGTISVSDIGPFVAALTGG